MSYRIYIDESGTHGDQWLVIGMLFVPDHAALHTDLCKAKDVHTYFNGDKRKAAKYREVHFTDFRKQKDIDVGKAWIDLFIKNNCFYRSIVIDWSLYNGKYFGDPFEPDALKRRRAYKKWAEMLLHPELKPEGNAYQIINAELYLDRLLIMYGYEIIEQLTTRFTGNYIGSQQCIRKFQHTDSWKDANQCLQLCDLLTGCLYNKLVPSKKPAKIEVREHLENALKPFGVREFRPEFWRGFAPVSLRKHLPKYSAWFWKPSEEGKGKGKGKNVRRRY
jgi:hypothetical protein